MATKIKNPIFGNWWRGVGSSKYETAFFDDFRNADISSEVGTLKCNLALKKDSGTTITEKCFKVVCPSGTVYFFSKTTGKIWSRSTAGVYAVVTANSNTSGHKGCAYYNGYVYYADSTTKLGRFVPDTLASRSDSWKTLANSNVPRPMKVQNLILHIGDGKQIYTVNASSAVSSGALVLEDYHTISAFHNYGYDLMVMTYTGGYKNRSGMFQWDTASVSWSAEWYIAEPGINFIIQTDRTDTFFIQAGTNGRIYQFDSQSISFWKQVRGVTTVCDGNQHQNSDTFNRKGLFGIAGNVYSILVPQMNMDWALNHEYTVSGGATSVVESIGSIGNTTPLVAWSNGSSYGVDSLDTLYATTIVTTPLISRRIHDILIYTDDLPTGTSIGLEVDLDGTGFVSKTVIPDLTDKFIVRLDGDIANKRILRSRVTLNPNNSTLATPSLSHIEYV